MPWTPDRVAHHEPFDQWRAVVRAARADGDEIEAAARQQHRLTFGVAEQKLALAYLVRPDALREIRSGQWF
jgi:hypothetical protein